MPDWTGGDGTGAYCPNCHLVVKAELVGKPCGYCRDMLKRGIFYFVAGSPPKYEPKGTK